MLRPTVTCLQLLVSRRTVVQKRTMSCAFLHEFLPIAHGHAKATHLALHFVVLFLLYMTMLTCVAAHTRTFSFHYSSFDPICQLEPLPFLKRCSELICWSKSFQLELTYLGIEPVAVGVEFLRVEDDAVTLVFGAMAMEEGSQTNSTQFQT